MWHEARKQERLIRGLIVDYRRRAERRKDFYEKIKAEPTQFLQLHGRQCKIHLDPAVAAAGEGPAIMMPWQGDTNNMIDRFDVRAHLDFIQEVKSPDIPPEELAQEERHCNYERYRILAQNAFLGISEDKFLQQLAIEEQFGVTIEEKETQKEKLSERKGTGAAIGYNYNDPGAQPSAYNGPDDKKMETKDSDEESDLDIIDVDLSIDVNKMEALQAHELNAVGPQFGMAGCDLFSFLTGDADDAEHQKQLMREEKEKAMFSGRKSRRERRAHRDKKLTTRVMSPPSYAAPSSFVVASRSPSRSPTRSPSPEQSTIEFITSFGPEDEEKPSVRPPKPLYADKVKQNLKKDMSYSEAVRKHATRSKSIDIDLKRPQIGPHGPPSRSRSRSHSKSRSRSRSASSRSRSKSCGPYRRTRSRSRSRNYRKRSRSISNITGGGHANRNRSRSASFESSDKAQKAVPRYYGRRKEDQSSSELSLDSDSSDSRADDANKSAVGNKSNTNQNQLRLSGSSSKGLSRDALSMKEKLKRKMQAQLSRQLRADKRAEAERQARELRRQARRDEEMRELAIKLRRKQREMRHQHHRHSSDEDSDGTRSGSSSRQSPFSEKKREDRSRSKSKPPELKQISVWETNKEIPSPPYQKKILEMGESSQYPIKRRYPDISERDDRRNDDIKEQNHQQNKYERYQSTNWEYGRKYDNVDHNPESRFQQETFRGSTSKRTYDQRGYRGQNSNNFNQNYSIPLSRYRDSEQNYVEGPSIRHRNADQHMNEPSTTRFRDTVQNFSDAHASRFRYSEQTEIPSIRSRDIEQKYNEGPSSRFRNCEQKYSESSLNRFRESEHKFSEGSFSRFPYSEQKYGEGPSNRFQHSEKKYSVGHLTRFRNSEKKYNEGPPNQFRDSGQNYGDGSAGHFRVPEQSYGDNTSRRFLEFDQSYGDVPSNRYRDSGKNYSAGPASRYRNPEPNYNDGPSSQYMTQQERESNHRNKVKLVDY